MYALLPPDKVKTAEFCLTEDSISQAFNITEEDLNIVSFQATAVSCSDVGLMHVGVKALRLPLISRADECVCDI